MDDYPSNDPPPHCLPVGYPSRCPNRWSSSHRPDRNWPRVVPNGGYDFADPTRDFNGHNYRIPYHQYDEEYEFHYYYDERAVCSDRMRALIYDEYTVKSYRRFEEIKSNRNGSGNLLAIGYVNDSNDSSELTAMVSECTTGGHGEVTLHAGVRSEAKAVVGKETAHQSSPSEKSDRDNKVCVDLDDLDYWDEDPDAFSENEEENPNSGQLKSKWNRPIKAKYRVKCLKPQKGSGKWKKSFPSSGSEDCSLRKEVTNGDGSIGNHRPVEKKVRDGSTFGSVIAEYGAMPCSIDDEMAPGRWQHEFGFQDGRSEWDGREVAVLGPNIQVDLPLDEETPSDTVPVVECSVVRLSADEEPNADFVQRPVSNRRPVFIDGRNVAMEYYAGEDSYCAMAITEAVQYFLLRDNPVTVILPFEDYEYSLSSGGLDCVVFNVLLNGGMLTFAPNVKCRTVGGMNKAEKDQLENFFANEAYRCGGVVMSNRLFVNTYKEMPDINKVVQGRVIRFQWNSDRVFRVGVKGDTVEELLVFGKNETVCCAVAPQPREETRKVLDMIEALKSSEDVYN